MARKQPASFLDQTPGSISVSSTGDWHEILAHEQLLPTSKGADVEIVAQKFWGLKFSSDRNAAYFKSVPKGETIRSNAWIGDAGGSGVMLLQAPSTPLPPLRLRDVVCAAFGIDYNGFSWTAVFLNFVDATGLANVTLAAPPQTEKAQDGQAQTLSLTVDSGVPTNAIWCTTRSDAYYSILRLSYQVTGVDEIINKAVSWVTASFQGLALKLPAASMPEVTVTLTRQSYYGFWKPTEDDLIERSVAVSFGFRILDFHLHIDLAKYERKLILTPADSGSITDILGCIKGALGSPHNVAEDLMPSSGTSHPFASIFDAVHLWYVQISDEGQRVNWAIGLITVWKRNGVDIVVALCYDSNTATFRGQLLSQADYAGAMDLRNPNWDPRLSPSSLLLLSGVDPAKLGDGLDLWKLAGLEGGKQPPIPHVLRSAEVSFSRPRDSATGSLLRISADLVRDGKEPKPGSGGGSPTGFSWDEAALQVAVVSPQDKTAAKAFSVDVFSTFTLAPAAGHAASVSPATFALGLHCDKTASGRTWLLRASATNLSVGLLRSFFDGGAEQEGAMAVMDRLALKSLDVIYTYQDAVASSFVMTGVLVLGGLELLLSYQHVSALLKAADATATQFYSDENPDGGSLPVDPGKHYRTGTGRAQSWFTARLSVGSPDSTVKAIANSIVPKAGDRLPSWVGDIPVNPASTGAGATGTPPTVELQFCSMEGDESGEPNRSVLTVWLSIAGVSMTFVQYHTASTTGAGGSGGGAGSSPGVVKRMLRVSVDQIPLMKDVPLVGELPQPFDRLEYVWVEDDDPSTLDPTLKGITKSELDAISRGFPSDIPPFQVKDREAPKDGTKPNIVLRAGHHFIVVVSGKVVLDHVFAIPRSTAVRQGFAGDGKDDSSSTAQDVAEAAPTKGSTKMKAGPLSVSALSLQYKDGSLVVAVDATLALGPLTFSVIGFAIKLDLSKVKLHHLASVVADRLISLSLHGIEVGVAQGPLRLEGVFIHDSTAEAEKYSGGIVVGFGAWQVLAIGQYAIQHATAAAGGFRAVFVYGKLDGPLVELEFATISGVRLGFGYNYAMRMPQLDELHRFPLIADAGATGGGSDPMKVLDAFTAAEPRFVYPKDGSGWFAAGMTVTAFDVLSLTAVLAVDMDAGKAGVSNAGVALALLGDGVIQMEPLLPPDWALFYVEIVVGVELNFVAGYVAANATIAPASHVYVPQAHLTGSASLYTWFAPNAHAGDWVVSLGGYARGYDPPAHYPRPGRIGVNFTMGDGIHVTGGLYVAVTPKCAMAGGALHMALRVGPVSAWCDVMLDAFINFKPFHFRATISLSVGVKCNIDALFVHTHIGGHIGAALALWGPNEFGGHAHVDFWFFGFSIDFGARDNSDAKQAVSLAAFYGMVKAPGPAAAPPAHDTIGTHVGVAQHKYTVEEGMVAAEGSGGASSASSTGDFPSTSGDFRLQAGSLQIRIDCSFALSGAHVRTPTPGDDGAFPAATLPAGADGKAPATPPVYSWPMHSKASNPIASTLELRIYRIDDASGAAPVLQDGFRAELVAKAAATALWSVYDRARDPLQVASGRPPALQNGSGATTTLVHAVRLRPPLPVLCPSPVVQFDAAAARRRDIAGDWRVLPAEAQGARFAGAYHEPAADAVDAAAQTQRWKDFGAMWNPDAVAAAAAATVPPLADVRRLLVACVADRLQWTVRPPSQRTGNRPAASGGTDPAPSVPRVNDDGRTDWQLLAAPPVQLVRDLDKYYPTLPYVAAVA